MTKEKRGRFISLAVRNLGVDPLGVYWVSENRKQDRIMTRSKDSVYPLSYVFKTYTDRLTCKPVKVFRSKPRSVSCGKFNKVV